MKVFVYLIFVLFTQITQFDKNPLTNLSMHLDIGYVTDSNKIEENKTVQITEENSSVKITKLDHFIHKEEIELSYTPIWWILFENLFFFTVLFSFFCIFIYLPYKSIISLLEYFYPKEKDEDSGLESSKDDLDLNNKI
ncbi:hypothetical protein MJH12_16955 [bacterium]|nr:hypothetical protein [bacterium]